MAEFVLTIYEPDDTTPLLEVGTAPDHPRPWLSVDSFGTESMVDLTEGTATIGRIAVRVLDPQSGGTQAIRAVTALLPQVKTGLRARLEDVTNAVVVKDGVLGDVVLSDNDVEYTFHIHDVQERQRRTPIFTTLDQLPAGAYRRALVPAGVAGGYGRIRPDGPPLLFPPVDGVEGVFRSYNIAGAYGGLFIGPRAYRLQLSEEQLDTLLQHAEARAEYDDDGNYVGDFYSGLIVRWRPASGGAWTTLPRMPVYRHHDSALKKSGTAVTTRKEEFFQPPGRFELSSSFDFILRMNVAATDTGLLPAPEQRIVVQVLPSGTAPSDSTPLYIEQQAGTLVRQILDGEYSPWDPQIRYDEDAIAAIEADAPMVRDVIRAPQPEMKAWLERRILWPLGYFPTLDDQGRFAPRRFRLPVDGDPIVNLTSANTRHSRWRLNARDTRNTLVWQSAEDAAIETPAYQSTLPARVLLERPIEDRYTDALSVGLAGEKAVEVDFGSFRSFTTSSLEDGGPAPRNALAERIARERRGEYFDRFRYGGDLVELVALRTDPAVEGLRVGDWCVVSVDALPDRGTGQRGTNRLMQVVRRHPVSPVEVELLLSDAGPAAQPLAKPTVGTVTANGLTVTVPVTAIPSVPGTPVRAVVQYAVAMTEPPPSSSLWRYAGERTTPGDVVLPTITEPGTVYVRVRTEGAGRISSGWTTTQSVALATDPQLSSLFLDVDEDAGLADLRWAPNPFTGGLRLRYRRYTATDGVPANFPAVVDGTLDVAASARRATIPLAIAPGQAIAVQVIPYETWDDATGVGGAFGPAAEVTAEYEELPSDPDANLYAQALATLVSATATEVTIAVTGSVPDAAENGQASVRLISATATLLNGPGVGATAASGTQWTFARPAAGNGPAQAVFEAFRPGAPPVVSDRDAIVIAEQGEQATYALQVTAKVTAETATSTTVQVTATDPTGDTGDITLVVDGAVNVTPPTPNVVSGPTPLVQSYAIARPAPGSGAGHVTFRATKSGRTFDTDHVTVPPQQTATLECRAELTETGPTVIEVTVTATDPLGGSAPTIAIESAHGIPGGIGAITRNGNTFTIPRPASGSGTGRVTFRATKSGRYADSDSVDVAEQGAAVVIPVSVRLTQVASTDASVRVRLSFSDPLGELAADQFSISITQHGVAAPSQVETGTGWREYLIGRPLPGNGPGRVQAEVSAPGRLADADTVDVPPQTVDVVLPTFEEVTSQSETQGTLTIVPKNDVQSRVQRVDFVVVQGRTATDSRQDSSPPYSTTVTLAEGVESYIEYAVIGLDAANTPNQVLARGKVAFAASARPAMPVIGLTVNESGQVLVHVQGDAQTKAFRWNYSKASYPTATSGPLVSGREFSATAPLTLALGERLYVTAVAYSNADGTGQVSAVARAAVDRQNKRTDKRLVIPSHAFVPAATNAAYARSAGSLTCTSGTHSFLAWLVLPPGAQITLVDFHVYRPDSSTFIQVSMARVGNTGGVAQLFSRQATLGSGWQPLSGVLSETVPAEQSYSLSVTLGPNARVSNVVVHYSVPDLATAL